MKNTERIEKRILAMFLCMMICISFLPVTAWAEEGTIIQESSEGTITLAEEDSSAADLAENQGSEDLGLPTIIERAELSRETNDAAAGMYTGTYLQTEARKVLDLVNEFRTGKEAWFWNSDDTTKTVYNDEGGTYLSELTYDYALEQIAMQRAAEIVVSFSHRRPNGLPCFSCTYNEVGSYGENIIMGTYMSAEQAVEGWKETGLPYSDQGHRRNMLKEDYNAIGVAGFEYNGMRYWVQEFSYYISSTAAAEPCDNKATCILDDEGNLAVSIINSSEDGFSGSCGDTVTWTLTGDGVLTISGTGDMWDFSNKNQGWLGLEENITSVVIENGVTNIGDYAFHKCEDLTSATIPDSVTKIGDSAFYECESLTSVTIPNRVKSIGISAFKLCLSMTSVTIPAGVTSIGNLAFADCDFLTDIKVASGNSYFSSIDGVLFNKEKTEIIQYPGGKREESYSIPSGVTTVGAWAFDDCFSLKSITIPGSVTTISAGAFNGCGMLRSIVIPSGVTIIANAAFFSCLSLEEVTIPDSVTTIGSMAFANCFSLTTIVFPAGITDIGSNAFYNCYNIMLFTFRGDAPTIDSIAFSGVAAKAIYPYGNQSWTEDVCQNYGGDILWMAYTGFRLNKSEISIPCGKSETLIVNVDNADGQVPANWSSSDSATATVSSNGVVTAKKVGKTVITAIVGGEALTCNVRVLFKDVTNPSLFYYEPIYNMVDRGVLAGWEDGTFRPMNDCNRAAVVTFLWRLAGKPEPSAMATFSDMTDNPEFNKAISWAAEQEITTGYAGNLFKPWATCNRAAIVTFLWRYAGKPEPTSMATFKDMTDNEDFNNAISWAAEKGITTGWDDNTFRPWNTCNRLAVASFLDRYSKL